TASGITTLQMNLGKRCNLACRHCHVQAGPHRIEQMTRETMEACVETLLNERIPVVDITGGAPEMNPHYRWLIEQCARTGSRVKTRTNLAILTEDEFTGLPAFLADNNVEVVASLPYFSADTTDRQRGGGVFEKAISALRTLNAAGYGNEKSGLSLNLVYNPCGAYPPPQQKAMEADFRRELLKRYGITFTSLFTITNMPLGRFLEFLVESKNLDRYMERLKASYNPGAAAKVMCRDTLSVGWDGGLYDCDFNQTLGLKCGRGAPDDITRFDAYALKTRRIVTGEHCYGCTAGAGSSCTGAVA
ncbi:MAG: arsenosugar biosynthesis radical SAM protein ArsS, partial [Deltaproteobacteria bacterium]|nr:arsenosugar biosynthesis radical SAM protein ArsS [Deltaproteobacteria bacterium]